MGSSYRGLWRVASFRPYTSKQVGDTGPDESARQRNSFRSSFSEARGTMCVAIVFIGVLFFARIEYNNAHLFYFHERSIYIL